jgi:hypothetical protein
MQANVAHQEQRRQDRILLVLAVTLVASQAFSDFLTRNALGVATLWPTNALLAGGLLVLNPRRRLILIVVAVIGHVAIDLLVGDGLGRAVLYTLIDLGEAVLVWRVTQRFFGGPPRVRTMRQLALLTTLSAPVTLLAAAIASTALALIYGMPFMAVLTDWFVCGVLGMAIVLPAMLVLLDSEHRRAFQRPMRWNSWAWACWWPVCRRWCSTPRACPRRSCCFPSPCWPLSAWARAARPRPR